MAGQFKFCYIVLCFSYCYCNNPLFSKSHDNVYSGCVSVLNIDSDRASLYVYKHERLGRKTSLCYNAM